MSDESTEIREFNDLKVKAPVLFSNGKKRVAKANEVGEKILQKMKAGMDQELVEQGKDFLKKISKTVQKLKEDRSPLTRLMDDYKRRFTALEAQLDKKKEDTIAFKIEHELTTYANMLFEKQQREADEAQKKREKEEEKIHIASQIEASLGQYFQDYISQVKTDMVNLFESATLESFDGIKKGIELQSTTYPESHYEQFTTNISAKYLSREEKIKIKADVIEGKYAGYAKAFKDEIQVYKDELIARLPSKKKELEAIEKADASKKKELEAAAEKRKEEEEKKRKEEDEKRKAAEAAAAEAKAQQKQMEMAFEAEATEKKVERAGFKITVKNPKGYAPIMSLWFEKQASEMAMDAIERMTIARMVKFAEKHAHENDELINSPFIDYKEVVKA
jgi:peptidoglycan hydrolase CwlO-like protein